MVNPQVLSVLSTSDRAGSSTVNSNGEILNDEHDAYDVWTRVDVGSQMSENSDSEDGRSMVMVSRASSPFRIRFQDVLSSPSIPMQISWPSTLPWFQFQDAYRKGRIKGKLRGQSPSPATMGTGSPTPRAFAMTLGTIDKELLPTPRIIEQVTAEISKVLPETFDGELAARMSTLAHGDEEEAKLEAFQLFVYQVSNKLIEDPDFDILDPNCGNDSKWSRTLHTFRGIGLSRRSWVQLFRANSGGGLGPTSAAFTENLFEAALQCQDVEIVGALLEAGVDPNRLVQVENLTQTPLQFVADWGKSHGVELTKLLLQAGARVKTVGSDNRPPLVIASANSQHSLDLVKLLVENGADIRQPGKSHFYEPVDLQCAIVAAIESSRMEILHSKRGDRSSDEGGSEAGLQGLDSTQKFSYLLSLYDRDNLIDQGRIQDALVMAAYRGRVDMMKALVEAGADVNRKSISGCTPLFAAAWRHHDAIPASDFLLRLGAETDPIARWSGIGRLNPTSEKTALHIAAAVGDADLARLLVDHGAEVGTLTMFSPQLDAPLFGMYFRDTKTCTRSKVLQRYRTPLQLALHRDNTVSFCKEPKSERCAMILLAAGAPLTGGELVQAASFNSTELVQTLLDMGADPNQKNLEGVTALEACLREGHADLAGMLLRAGAHLTGGELFHAFKCGSRDLVDTLLAHGATLEDCGRNGESCLEGAILGRNTELIRQASENWEAYSYDDGALCAAVCSEKAEEDLELITQLLQRRPLNEETHEAEVTAIGYAAYHQKWDILDRLLDIEGPGTCIVPLPECHEGYKTLILHNHWAIKDAYKQPFWYKSSMIRCSVLVPAILSQEWSAVEDLLTVGYRPDQLSLLVAMKKSSPQQISMLLARGAHPNIAARHFLDTPLQLAARFGRFEAVRLLLRHRANVNALPAVLVPTPNLDYEWDRYAEALLPRTALQAAAELGELRLINLLLAAGADVNGAWALDGGASALQLAAAKGYLGVVRKLVSRGANIDAKRAEIFGRTALEGAAEQGRLDAVQFLLALGAKTTCEWGRWQYLRAVGFAAKNGHPSVERLLMGWRTWDVEDKIRRTYHGLLADDFEELVAETWVSEYGYYEDEEHSSSDDDEHSSSNDDEGDDDCESVGVPGDDSGNDTNR